MSLTEEDYINLLQGKSKGHALSGGCYLVNKNVKNHQTSIGAALLKEKVGLPVQLNPNYPRKRKKVEESLLKFL